MFAFEVTWTEVADLDRPGIYEWLVGDNCIYVGNSKRLPRRLRQYPNNVRRLSEDLPYGQAKPSAYRLVHHDLLQAHKEGRAIRFNVIENCTVSELSARERYWMANRGMLNR